MKTKKTGIPVYVFCSRQSARQFIKLYAGIRPIPYWFHQTLTFPPPQPDIALAHAHLKTLLDGLEKSQPEMACFWVREQEKETGYHFHVIFLFFGNQPLPPERTRQTFGAEVRRKWKKIVGDDSNPNANLTKLHEKADIGILYLTKWAKIVSKTKRSVLWHGQRNKRLISANSCPAPKSEVKRLLKICFDDRNWPDKPASEPTPSYFGKRELKDLKDYVKADDKWEWETFKRWRTGRKGKVTDEDLMAFFNKETGAKQPPSKHHPRIPSFFTSNNRKSPDDGNEDML
jgi:hypothetical protein